MKISKFIKKIFRRSWFFEDVTKVQDTEGYYKIAILCGNCKSGDAIFVKRGVYLKDVILSVKCKNCGCRLKGE